MLSARNIFINLWYILPLVILLLTRSHSYHTLIICIFLLLLGWNCGCIISKRAYLRDRFRAKLQCLRFAILTILGITFSLQLVALRNLLSQSILIGYRSLVFQDPTFMFGSSVLSTFYESFLLVLVSGSIPVAAYFTDKRLFKIIFYLLVASLVLDGIIKLGRFQAAYALFWIVLLKDRLGISKKVIIVLTSVGIAASFYIIYLREFSWYSSFDNLMNNGNILVRSFLNYNLVGLSSFQKLAGGIQDSHDLIVTPLNLSIISPLIYYLEVFLARFDIHLWYGWKDAVVDFSTPYYLQDLEIYTNAFTTNLYPFYLDLGYLGPLILGLLLGTFSNLQVYGPLSFMISSISLQVMVFGIYQPVVTHPFMILVYFPLLFGICRVSLNE